MLTWLKACPYEKCYLYGQRFTRRYCQACGQTLKPIVMCCDREDSYYDEGVCGACGTPKQLRFMLPQPVVG